MTALEVRVRRINLTIFEFITEVVGAKTVSAFMTSAGTVATISNAVTFFDVVAGLSAPVAHFAIVLAPSVKSPIANCHQSPASPLALEVRGVVHVTIDASVNPSDCIGSSKSFRASVHGEAFGLEGLLKGTDVPCELCGFGVVGAEILYFTL